MKQAKPRADWDWADRAATRLVKGYQIKASRGLELRDKIAAALRKAAEGRDLDEERPEVPASVLQ